MSGNQRRLSHGCEACRRHDTSTLTQVGKTEHDTFFGGKARETITRYECAVCKARWLHRVESGVGGHGDFWEPDDTNVA
jgi:hypothetical protein